jgi:NADH:ubiquinone oxidoreductase subunit H
LFLFFYLFLSFNIDSIIFEILNILFLIDFILIGGVLPLLERKYLALIQRRVGPKYVGYKGRLQFIADALKVFLKDYFYIFRVNKFFFYFLPFLFFNVNLYLAINLIWGNNIFLLDLELNIIFILILSAFSNFCVFLVGFFCRNKYTVIASVRVVNVFFVNELLLTIIICQYVFYSQAFSFSNYSDFKANHSTLFLFGLYIPVIFYIFLLDINRVPFDYIEAESELIMGYTNEYTGFLFGVFVLIEYLHIFFFSYFLVILFF